MAKLRRRGDGVYFLDYYDIDGRRYRVSTRTALREVAALWFTELERQLALARLGHRERIGRFGGHDAYGQGKPESRRRLTEYRDEYMERCKRDLEFADSTIALVETSFDSLIGVIGDSRLNEIRDNDIRKWKREIAGRVSGTTVMIYQRMLKAAFHRAVKWSYLEMSPFVGVETPRSKAKRTDMPTEHVRILLESIKDSRFAMFVRFLLYTGCRRNEILYLKCPDDIDEVNWTLRVNARKTGKVFLIPINKALREVVSAVKLPRGYLFESERHPGRPWNEDTVTHRFKRELRRAGLPDHYTLHSLRHTYTTVLRERGVPRDIIGVLLGHSSPRTTVGYDHTMAVDFRRYADLLDPVDRAQIGHSTVEGGQTGKT